MAKDPRPWGWLRRTINAHACATTAKLRGLAGLPTETAPLTADVGYAGVKRMAMRAQREEHVLNEFLSTLWAGSIFYDIGACLGLWPVHVANYEPTAKVNAIEPYPETNHRLGCNAEFYDFWASGFALGDEHTSVYFPENVDGIGGAVKPETGGSIKRYMYPLDFVCKARQEWPTHIKIDVEGQEIGVLKGAERALEAANCVVVECHKDTHSKVYNLLDCAGFRLKTFGRGDQDGWHWILGQSLAQD